MDTKRLQFEIPKKEAEELDQLQGSLGLKTRVALFNEAITFYKWAVDERRKGRIIASVDEEKEEYKEIEMISFPDPHPDLAVDAESLKEAQRELEKILEQAENKLELSEIIIWVEKSWPDKIGQENTHRIVSEALKKLSKERGLAQAAVASIEDRLARTRNKETRRAMEEISRILEKSG